jgi:hypothetical protein
MLEDGDVVKYKHYPAGKILVGIICILRFQGGALYRVRYVSTPNNVHSEIDYSNSYTLEDDWDVSNV